MNSKTLLSLFSDTFILIHLIIEKILNFNVLYSYIKFLMNRIFDGYMITIFLFGIGFKMYNIPKTGKDRKKLRIRLYIPQSLEILSKNERSLLNAQKSKDPNEFRYIPYIPSPLNPSRPELLRCVIDYFPSKRHKICIYKIQEKKKKKKSFSKKSTSKLKTSDIISNKGHDSLKTQYNNISDYVEPITQNIKIFHNSLIQRPRTIKQNLSPKQVLHSARDELEWRLKSRIKFNTKFDK